jgi:hypothetical protein
MKTLLKVLFSFLLITIAGFARADAEVLRPFILGSKATGTIDAVAETTKSSLSSNGFEIVGTYKPYGNALILIVTNEELKQNAANSEYGGFGAAQRVALTKVGGEIQVSYTNPVYMANVYRMKSQLTNVKAKLASALGELESFGAKGMSAEDARTYHYMVGMEYFTDPSILATYKSHEEAVAAVENGLAQNKFGVKSVFKIDLPRSGETLFGVALKGSGDQKAQDDSYIMSEIDFKDLKSTAHLPYEILVSKNTVLAQYARFRIAINFPDLAMMGSHSFVNIMSTPEAIRKALKATVTGAPE